MSYAINRSARHEYEILQTFEGGLMLSGAEVKSIRAGNTSLKGAFLRIENGELFLKNMHIGHYLPAGQPKDGADTRTGRKVLVSKKELGYLRGKQDAERLTIVPLSLYNRRGLVKVEFALARGKKAHEKRDALKKRDVEREIRANMHE
ncbi:SsrA-binding protein SmpB [Patescibacteria group bacterium]|jgi:SsrA-binding protein|nr:SsrA-binding protein SmpB [Patescibacteria group bacterium]